MSDALPLLVRLEPAYIDNSSIRYDVVAQVSMTGVQLLRIPMVFMEAYSGVIGYGSITKLESGLWESGSFNPRVSGLIANGNEEISSVGIASQNLLLLVNSKGLILNKDSTVATIWVSRPTLAGVNDSNAKDVNVTYNINGAIQFAGEVSATSAQIANSQFTGVVGSSDFPAYVTPATGVLGSNDPQTGFQYLGPREIPSAWISVVVEDAIGSTASVPKLLKIVGGPGTTAGNVEILNISGTANGVTLGKDVSNGPSDFLYKRTVLDEDIGNSYIEYNDGSPSYKDIYALYMNMDDTKVNRQLTFESGDILALSRLAIGLTNYADGVQLKSFSPEQVLAADYNLNGQIDGGDLLGLLKQMGTTGSSLPSLRWTVFDKDDVSPSAYLGEYDLQSDNELEALAKPGGPLKFFATKTLNIDLQKVVLQTSEDLIVKGLSNQAPDVVSVLVRGNVVGPISFTSPTLTSNSVSDNQTFSFTASNLFKQTLPGFKVGDKIVLEPNTAEGQTAEAQDYLFDDITSVVLNISPANKVYSWDQGLYKVHLADAFTSSPTTTATTLEVYRIVYPDFGTVLFLNKGDSLSGALLDRNDWIIELPGYFIDKDHDLTIVANDNDGNGSSSEVEIVVLGIDPPG